MLIVVEGEVVPKGRARITRSGIAYTPKKTRDYENKLAFFAAEVMKDSPLLEGPLWVCVRVSVSIPESWSKKKRALALAGEIKPIGRPDLDNYIKILDALNGIVWKDDSQIVEISAFKYYGEKPRLFVDIDSV